MKRVERAPLTVERQRLAETGIPIARDLADRFGRRRPWLRDEFESAAMFVLVILAADLDKSLWGVFGAHAHVAVTHAMLNVIRHSRLKGFRGSELVPPELVSLPRNDVEMPGLAVVSRSPLEETEAFEMMLAPLSSRQRTICRLLYRDGLNQREAGKAIGISKGRASRAANQAWSQLKQSQLCPA